jgi:hypothetical protein
MWPAGSATVFLAGKLQFFEEVEGYDDARGLAEYYSSLFFSYRPYNRALSKRYFYRPTLMGEWKRVGYSEFLERLDAWRLSACGAEEGPDA